ncbi:class I SAM-dependent methyltransferase [Brevibacillus panacihumi]|uniref:Class I SAM-dependent methyltransferase n=1 Tax=Brevibacillus panacihumi TaxID=497735 RepID=A0A3M8CJQ8_9BACL|nr:class I SAM-dependent methyltransferase [Brevibacillus panacihumi]RNB75105.1 class I SAM-dependent methyltransferase [Brevibacillus panacihumi]
MNINFHDEKNKTAYSGRSADETWLEAMRAIIDPAGKRVVDVGCGGGIYSQAWLEFGAKSVVGVDFSHAMLGTARSQAAGQDSLAFVYGDALHTGLPDASVDIVFARALIHHLTDLEGFFAEACRLLAPGGVAIVQDRTMEDVMVPGSPRHIRGFFFEVFPFLLEKERSRRPDRGQVEDAMAKNGFTALECRSLLETRRRYADWRELEADVRARTGRSILHALTDAELDELIDAMRQKLYGQTEIVEQDRWSIWIGKRDGGILA